MTTFDLDGYLRQCVLTYRYLNQGDVWVPRKPRNPLPVADMDSAWRHNAANFLLRRAEHLASQYRFGMVQSAATPSLHEVIGEDAGQPVFSGAVFSELDLMSDHAQDAFDDAQDQITDDPETWLKTTVLYRAVTSGLPSGTDRERLGELAKHWSTCPARTDSGDCVCATRRDEAQGVAA